MGQHHHGRLALGLEPGDVLLERLGDETVGVAGHVHHVRLVGREDPESADIGRGLGDHDVARVEEHAGHEVERLLGPGRHDDVVGVGVDPLERHDLQQLVAQPLVALARGVLQRREPLVVQQPLHRVPDQVHGQGADVRHTPGQGDHLRAGGDGEQGADLGDLHPGGACGIGLDPGIQP